MFLDAFIDFMPHLVSQYDVGQFCAKHVTKCHVFGH